MTKKHLILETLHYPLITQPDTRPIHEIGAVFGSRYEACDSCPGSITVNFGLQEKSINHRVVIGIALSPKFRRTARCVVPIHTAQ